MARDEFSKQVKNNLASRAGHHCSNPDCRASTSGPHEDANRSTSAGEASHIHAASPGGPRYNPEMTSKQRASIENGIWLCRICAGKVDKDKENYPANLLRQWKAGAEEEAGKRQGRPKEKDHALDSLTQAFTRHPQKFLPDAIRNVVSCSEKAMEDLLPGSKVEATVTNGIPRFSITAKEAESPPSMLIASKSQEDTSWMKKMLEEGRPFTLPDSFEIIGGFPRELLEGAEKLVIGFDPLNTIEAELALRNTSGEDFTLISIPGTARLGVNLLSFKGVLGNGVVIAEVLLPRDGDSEHTPHVSLNLDIRKWEGSTLGVLPYFPQVRDLIALLASDKGHASLKLEGHVASQGTLTFGQSSPFIGVIEILDLAHRLAVQLDTQIPFSFDALTEFANVGFKEISKLPLAGKMMEDVEECCHYTLALHRDSDEPLKIPERGSFRFVCPPSQIPFFGRKLSIPSLTVTLSGVTPELHGEPENSGHQTLRLNLDQQSTVIKELAGPLELECLPTVAEHPPEGSKDRP